MNEPDDDAEDRELRAQLRRWELEAPSEGLEQRLRRSYRGLAKPPVARWAVRGGQVVLPAPVAALIVLALLLLGAAAGRRVSPHPVESHAPGAPSLGGLANLTVLPEVRVTVVARGEDDDQR